MVYSPELLDLLQAIDPAPWAGRTPGGRPTRACRATTSRLLARRPDGQGRYFQFLGWSPRRYRTSATVISVEDQIATLILPEWHPTLPVHLPLRLLPASAQTPDAQLALTADLSAPAAGKLNPASLTIHRNPPKPKHGRPV